MSLRINSITAMFELFCSIPCLLFRCISVHELRQFRDCDNVVHIVD